MAAGAGSISEEWDFVDKVVGRYDALRWEVDLGADYDTFSVVPAALLHRIQHDLNAPGVVDSYLKQRARQGFLTSRRLGADRRPVAT